MMPSNEGVVSCLATRLRRVVPGLPARLCQTERLSFQGARPSLVRCTGRMCHTNAEPPAIAISSTRPPIVSGKAWEKMSKAEKMEVRAEFRRMILPREGAGDGGVHGTGPLPDGSAPPCSRPSHHVPPDPPLSAFRP